ncbi:oocyst capsule protein [Hepatocystis sp. ex Piliocolobus tephrosceles]|nr:oocyst capsule protein [Hepatocystis sp. ex Piliocolobus tephrosceles]
MLSGNIFFTLLVCLFGITHSLELNDSNPLLNSIQSTPSSQNVHTLAKRYIATSYINQKTCVLKNKNICSTRDYEITIKNGYRYAFVNVLLVQNGKSSIVSVYKKQEKFKDDGTVVINFYNIPSLKYNVRIETTDVMYNEEYTIGDECMCGMCQDTQKLDISLTQMGTNIIHRIQNNAPTEFIYTHNYFVHGKYLLDQFNLYRKSQNKLQILDYEIFYEREREFAYPCSGLIMYHAWNYNIHYHLDDVTCFYVSLMDKFLKNLLSHGYKRENFVGNHIYLFFNNMNEESENLVVTDMGNVNVNAPQIFDDEDNMISGNYQQTKGITINTKHILEKVKYIYNKGTYNKMAYMQLFRAFSKLFLNHYKISHEQLLQYTTGFVFKMPDSLKNSESHKEAYEMYAEELAVLLSSLEHNFYADILGFNLYVLLQSDEEFNQTEGNINEYAYMDNDTLILKSTYVHCAEQIASVSKVLKNYLVNKIVNDPTRCDRINVNNVDNLLVMQNTFLLDCIVSQHYEKLFPLVGFRLMENKTFITDASIQLINNHMYEYTLLMDITIDEKSLKDVLLFNYMYNPEDTIVEIAIFGHKYNSKKLIDVKELGRMYFRLDCDSHCTNKQPIVVNENIDYILISDICFKHNRMSKRCITMNNTTYVFDMRLVRLANNKINPYPEILRTEDVQKSIIEIDYCEVLKNYIQPEFIYSKTRYNDVVCREYVNNLAKNSTKLKLHSNILDISYFDGFKKNIQVTFSTKFNERVEEMFQVALDITNTQETNKTYIISYFNDSCYMTNNVNSTRYVPTHVTFVNDNDSEYDIYLHEHESEAITLTQTAKSNNINDSSYNNLNINYSHLKKNVFMQFVNDYIYFYQENIENNEHNNTVVSQTFTNVSAYNYDCLGVYAYLMNKFNILVNSSLNCEGLHMIVEVLLKGKLGKYFVYKQNKIVLQFYEHINHTYSVFDLVNLEIYDLRNNLILVEKMNLNVSIEEANLNLLYNHKNVSYGNKYFSNVYILFFKIAYLINELDFDMFVYDVTGGIQIIDSEVLKKKNSNQRGDINNIKEVLNKYKIDIDKHTVPSVELINEIALLSAYLVELTSSYKHIGKVYEEIKTFGLVTRRYSSPLANIRYFVYIDAFKYSEDGDQIIDKLHHELMTLNTLVIIKKALCCSNFVDVLSKSLEYYIAYKYIKPIKQSYHKPHSSSIAYNIVDEPDIDTAKKIIDIWLNHADLDEHKNPDMNTNYSGYMAKIIMNNSKYYYKKEITNEEITNEEITNEEITVEQITAEDTSECIDLDMIDHYHNVVIEFSTEMDKHGAAVNITLDEDVIKQNVTNVTDIYLVYFLFRNLSMPFKGRTYPVEVLSNQRIILVKGTRYFDSTSSSLIIYRTYLDIIHDSALYMLEKVIFVKNTENEIIKEFNVEYQTFFVHPLAMIEETLLDTKEKISMSEQYYNTKTKCAHYHNGVQSCDIMPYNDSNILPVYVSYLENNQRKDIIFLNKDNKDVLDWVHNDAKVLSKQYQIQLHGSKMSVDVYSTIEVIVYEITSLMGIKHFGNNKCKDLVLNNGKLYIEHNDSSTLISKIKYETTGCIDVRAIYKNILENCEFKKDELKLLFGGPKSHILPYYLDDNFLRKLNVDELRNLIYYIITIPNILLYNIKLFKNKLLTISELEQQYNATEDATEDVLLKVENDFSIKISHKLLQNNTNMYTFINTLYMKMMSLNNMSYMDYNIFEYHVTEYLNGNNTCDDNFNTISDIILPTKYHGIYNRPTYIYTPDLTYLKKKSDYEFLFNNLYLFEHNNYANEKFLKAILVLTYNKMKIDMHDILIIELIANSLDNKNQLRLECYPDEKVNPHILFEEYNLEKDTKYIVCKSIPVKDLIDGLYVFNRYIIKSKDIFEQIVYYYENMPVKPIYKVNNNSAHIPGITCEGVTININKSETNNLVSYMISIKNDFNLNINPYEVFKPIFNLEQCKDIIDNVFTLDDFINSHYIRELRSLEYKDICSGKNIYVNENLELLNVNIIKKEADISTYKLTVSKEHELEGIEIIDMNNNKILFRHNSANNEFVCIGNNNNNVDAVISDLFPTGHLLPRKPAHVDTTKVIEGPPSPDMFEEPKTPKLQEKKPTGDDNPEKPNEQQAPIIDAFKNDVIEVLQQPINNGSTSYSTRDATKTQINLIISDPKEIISMFKFNVPDITETNDTLQKVNNGTISHCKKTQTHDKNVAMSVDCINNQTHACIPNNNIDRNIVIEVSFNINKLTILHKPCQIDVSDTSNKVDESFKSHNENDGVDTKKAPINVISEQDENILYKKEEGSTKIDNNNNCHSYATKFKCTNNQLNVNSNTDTENTVNLNIFIRHNPQLHNYKIQYTEYKLKISMYEEIVNIVIKQTVVPPTQPQKDNTQDITIHSKEKDSNHEGSHLQPVKYRNKNIQSENYEITYLEDQFRIRWIIPNNISLHNSRILSCS